MEENNNSKPGKYFFILALFLLIIGLSGGLLSSLIYVLPEFMRDSFGFSALRPLHVSSVMFWIILGATGAVYSAVNVLKRTDRRIDTIAKIQLALWLIALVGIYGSYFSGNYGGREYWEFDPVWAIPIVMSWLLFLFNFLRMVKGIGRWPVYVWMWMTGIVFFLFIFLENYLWIFPYFREDFVADMTIQWKVNGSLVGALNQLLYGTSFFLMDRISGKEEQKIGFSRMAFTMYFLGLANLMFNWGHHIYTLPTENYVRYVAYIVSMTEWVFFIRIIYNWRKQLKEVIQYHRVFPYRFLAASEFWVFVNLGQALLMSIPALNLYTHGTHVTVAHAMGTTIGINTMILMAAVFMFVPGSKRMALLHARKLNTAFWLLQGALLVFFVTLDIAGIIRGLWQLEPGQPAFREMMESLYPWYGLMIVAGSGILIALVIFSVVLLSTLLKTNNYENNN